MNLKQALNIDKPSLFSKKEIHGGETSFLSIKGEQEKSRHAFKFIIGGSGSEIIEIKGDLINMRFYIKDVVKDYDYHQGDLLLLDVEDYLDGKENGEIKITSAFISFDLPYLNTPHFILY